MKTVRTIIFILLLGCLVGCKQLQMNNSSFGDRSPQSVAMVNAGSNIREVTTPKVISDLNQELEKYHPQVTIIAPRAEKTVSQTDVTLKLEVEGLPIFQDDQLHLGNHLNLIVDNEPFQQIYSLDDPIVIKNLAPGTHSIRVFAVRPWGESFKNEGAYTQITFNVLTETDDNRPNSDFPLLTYNSPTGIFGAEPLLLDFYLDDPNSAKLEESSNTEKWLVKATVNGSSFMIKDWQPYYLTGFEPGDNWIQLELVDESGNTIKNAFNNTVKVFTYDPQQQDTLAQLINDEISVADAQGIVNQSYYIQPVESPEIAEFKSSVEPEIITEELVAYPDNLPEVDYSIPDQDKELQESKANLPEIDFTPQTNSEVDQVNNVKTAILDKIPESEIKNIITNIEPSLELESSDDSPDLLNQLSNVAATSNVEVDAKSSIKPDITTNKIVITESDAPKDEVIEIIVPQTESVEIANSDIAITIPRVKSEQDSSKPESVTTKLLWWKKILIRVRQAIEALARQLPNEI